MAEHTRIIADILSDLLEEPIESGDLGLLVGNPFSVPLLSPQRPNLALPPAFLPSLSPQPPGHPHPSRHFASHFPLASFPWPLHPQTQPQPHSHLQSQPRDRAAYLWPHQPPLFVTPSIRPPFNAQPQIADPLLSRLYQSTPPTPGFGPARDNARSLPLQSSLACPPREPISDDFLDGLLEGDFSSPALPPQSPRFFLGAATPLRSRNPIVTMPATREQRRKRSAALPSDLVEIQDSSPATPSSGGAGSRRRRPSQESAQTSPAEQRRSRKRPRPSPAKIEFDPVDESLFSDPEEDVINLADPDEAAKTKSEPEPEPEVDNSVRLGAFQCVICMDNVKDLTVTFCGHLFCSECLFSSLLIDDTKKICPICRQKVDTRPASGKFSTKARGFWPLELKLMTAKRSSKLPGR